MFLGDICQQFTREMFDMYQGFASYKNWDFELVNYTNAEYGAYLSVYPCSFMRLSSLVFLTTGEIMSNLCGCCLLVSGGLHHAAARITGENVYRHLKHEGGTHRVQRIPEVGLSSRMQRIHTGTMTVIILPQPAEVESEHPVSRLFFIISWQQSALWLIVGHSR